MNKPAFMPSPRPRPRTSDADAHQLAAANSDLGFTRPSNPPPAPIVKDPAGAAVLEVTGPSAQAPKSTFAPAKGAALKFEVPDQVWTSLRQEALNRRVTVKFLVLEALAAKGYAIDMAAIPEDGRRNR